MTMWNLDDEYNTNLTNMSYRLSILFAQLPYHLTPIMEYRVDNMSSCILFFSSIYRLLFYISYTHTNLYICLPKDKFLAPPLGMENID